MEDERTRRLVAGEAWADFCASLLRAGDIVLEASATDLERAEGFRYLTRLMRNSIERFVENSEPYRPRVRDTPWRVSIAIQSPDQDHPLIEIDGNDDYVIRGTRGTVNYASFLALAGRIPTDAGTRSLGDDPRAALNAFDPTDYRATGFLSVHDLALEPDGSFVIHLSRQRHDRNWLRLEADSSFIMVRQTFLDRRTEVPMQLSVERVEPLPVRPITPADMATALAKTSQNVVGTATRFLGWAQMLASAPNQLRTIGGNYSNAGGSPDHLMYFGYWAIEPNEALVITARLPGNDHWNFQACSWWLENFDNYEDSRGYTTRRTARVEDDGTVVLVLAHRDLGFGNWIDLFAHTRGTMNLRIVHPEGDATITVEKRVV